MLQRPLPSSQFLELSGAPNSSLTKSEIIAGFLQNLALPSVFHRELTEADFALWDRLLAPYSTAAIEYAFDNWGRNAKKFPLPGDIIGLCGVWAEGGEIQSHFKEKNRGTGLAPNVVLALLPQIVSRAERFHAEGYDCAPALTEPEVVEMVQRAKLENLPTEQAKQFPNGNSIYNRELTQARALLRIKLRRGGRHELSGVV